MRWRKGAVNLDREIGNPVPSDRPRVVGGRRLSYQWRTASSGDALPRVRRPRTSSVSGEMRPGPENHFIRDILVCSIA